jgi:hypothetical protein
LPALSALPSNLKVNRSRLVRKMNPRSLRELGRTADKLKLVHEKPQSF